MFMDMTVSFSASRAKSARSAGEVNFSKTILASISFSSNSAIFFFMAEFYHKNKKINRGGRPLAPPRIPEYNRAKHSAKKGAFS